MRELLRDTRRATAAVLAGTALGMIGRVARASVARPPRASGAHATHAARPSTAVDWPTMDPSHAWTRLAASLDGTGPVFLQLGLIAASIVAVAAGARAVAAWRAERRGTSAADGRTSEAARAMLAQGEGVGAPPRAQHASATTFSPTHSDAAPVGSNAEPMRVRVVTRLARLVPARRPRAARPRRGATPATVRALAESGVPRAEIARRTGLSQDAVGLALAV